ELLAEGLKLLKDTGLLGITEYGRAVHAEMEALLSAARNGIAIRGGTLYTTTYPCHNCAKHIVAAGIKKVKFVEPYPKSYATKM
ncbi:deaminase, partial [Salmonella enterica subsp. enterica serovar Typhimurium]|uniref:deaminase n=1 Tax=Salmonella enterica TaxID=28901 RepID=UPI0020A3418E